MIFDGYKEAKHLDSKISLLLEKHPPEYGEHLREWLCFCRTLTTGLQLIEVAALKSVAPMPEQKDLEAKIQKMQALLGRAVKALETAGALPPYEEQLLYDIKTLLKEAKGVKRGN